MMEDEFGVPVDEDSLTQEEVNKQMADQIMATKAEKEAAKTKEAMDERAAQWDRLLGTISDQSALPDLPIVTVRPGGSLSDKDKAYFSETARWLFAIGRTEFDWRSDPKNQAQLANMVDWFSRHEGGWTTQRTWVRLNEEKKWSEKREADKATEARLADEVVAADKFIREQAVLKAMRDQEKLKQSKSHRFF